MASLANLKSQHIILFVIWVVLKIINRRWWVKLDPNVRVLVGELDRLRWLKQDEVTASGTDINHRIIEEPES
jgi:yeast amino acid transporter